MQPRASFTRWSKMNPALRHVLAYLLFVSACGPTPPEPAIDALESEIVSWETIPHPFPEATYFLFGANLKDGPRAVLVELLEDGIVVQDAYYPHTSICMAVFLDQMIVVLEAPDERMENRGFTTNSDRLGGSCITHWSRYTIQK